MSGNDKSYLAHFVKSLAVGFFFLFLGGAAMDNNSVLKWTALAVAIVAWVAGSLMSAAAELDDTE
jgi:hypothetical protein